jgi:hypothetical protein
MLLLFSRNAQAQKIPCKDNKQNLDPEVISV